MSTTNKVIELNPAHNLSEIALHRAEELIIEERLAGAVSFPDIDDDLPSLDDVELEALAECSTS